MSALALFAAAPSTWVGTNTLHDPTTGKPEESSSRLTIAPMLDGRFVRLDYTWSYQNTPQSGSFLFGLDPETSELSAYWIDTWHMGRKALLCAGTVDDGDVLNVRGSYAAPPGPDWGWRIEVERTGDQSLRIAHYNIFPDGKEEPAVEAVYKPE